MAILNKATERISLKATPADKARIDRAAAISQKGRTEFMLDAALKSADKVIQNQTEFWFDESAWDALNPSAFMNDMALSKVVLTHFCYLRRFDSCG